MHDVLIVFAREPRIGQVKKRIARDAGDLAALAIYRRLLDRVLRLARSFTRTSARSAGPASVPVVLRISAESLSDSDGRLTVFAGQTTTPITGQVGSDLGKRMANAMNDAWREGARRVVLVGADAPTLRHRDLRLAFAALDQHDVVISPTRDGGYCLIGARRGCQALFDDMPWGTDEIASLTEQRARGQQLEIHQLGTQSDVDYIVDWQQWCASRGISGLQEHEWDL